jgi:hypothetical protein
MEAFIRDERERLSDFGWRFHSILGRLKNT